jgi:hypothetical protein
MPTSSLFNGLFTPQCTTLSQSHRLTFEPAYFQESGGQVVMEAEHFTWNLELSQHNWISQTTLSGFIGPAYLSALPDTDLQFTANYTQTSPELQYAVNFTTTGTYNVWIRGYAPNGAGDSVYIALDNQTPLTPTVLTGFSPAQWGWAARNSTSSNPVTFEISEPGLHTLHIWQREDGPRLDRILLTSDNHYNPTDSGPPESEFK